MDTPLTLWTNADFPAPAMEQLRHGIGPIRLLLSQQRNASNLAAGSADPLLAEADIAFGQPDPKQLIQCTRVKWIHLTTAGYTRYDTDAVRSALKARGAILTNSSGVYDEPCAQHVLSMILALARQLPQCWANQATTRGWRSADHRARTHLLEGQTAVILGLGAIARRLVEFLEPHHIKLIAVRRNVTGNEPVETISYTEIAEVLPQADHVINVLPANASTERLIDAKMLAAMKPGALFYNIGRGNTVDQSALQAALESGHLGGAYLDVTDPEPLPPEHPLWKLPNCWITPHTAGGHADEFERLVNHFINNLQKFQSGEPLLDRII